MSQDFGKLIRNILIPLDFNTAEREFLRQLRFFSGRYSDFEKILAHHEPSQVSLLAGANRLFSGRMKDPVNSVFVALSLLGFVPSRNYLAASLLKKRNTELLPNDQAILEMLHFALLGEKVGREFAFHFFAAGFVFDLLAAMRPEPEAGAPKAPEVAEVPEVPETQAEQGEAVPSELDLELGKVWKHGLDIAQVACQLSKAWVPHLKLEPDLSVDALVHDLGRIVAVLAGVPLTGISLAGVPNGGEGNLATDSHWLAETKAAPWTHNVLGHLALSRVGFLTESSWVALYHHQPFLAEKLGERILVRTWLIWLADHICRVCEYRKSKKLNETLVTNWSQAVQPYLKGVSDKKFRSTLSSLVVP